MSVTSHKLPTLEDFADQLNSDFTVTFEDGTSAGLRLLSADSLISTPTQVSFSLLFRAPLDAPPFQGLFQVKHQSLGSMDLFLVPVKQDEDGLYFEAVFNNLIR